MSVRIESGKKRKMPRKEKKKTSGLNEGSSLLL